MCTGLEVFALLASSMYAKSQADNANAAAERKQDEAEEAALEMKQEMKQEEKKQKAEYQASLKRSQQRESSKIKATRARAKAARASQAMPLLSSVTGDAALFGKTKLGQ